MAWATRHSSRSAGDCFSVDEVSGPRMLPGAWLAAVSVPQAEASRRRAAAAPEAKPSRRVLEGSEWNKVTSDDLRDAMRAAAPADLPKTSGTSAFDAFLSYRHGDPDELFTRELRRRLLEAGFKVALDRLDFFPACTFLEEMERCVRSSRYTVAVISPRYFESGNTTEEAIITQVLGMDERKRRLIPLIYETATMPAWLYGLVGIDFSREDPDVDPYERLIAALREARDDQ